MKPLRSDDIYGNWGTLLLPINEDQSIDYIRLGDQIDYLTSIGLNGIYTNGTAGEFYTQSEEEFDRIHTLFAEKCESRGVPFQIGASHMSPQISLDRIKRAKQFRPSAIQVILSDWFPLKDEEAIHCLQRMAEAADPIGLVLYNPPHSKRVLSPETIAMLKSAVPQIVGIKVAGGDEAWYRAMNEHLADLSVFIPGHHLATGFSRGAAGAYSNMACLHPIGAQRWYELMKTDLDQALELEARVLRFTHTYMIPFITEQGFSNQAVDKLLAAIGGWGNAGTRLRWPYRFIPESEALRLRPIAQQLIPEFFPS